MSRHPLIPALAAVAAAATLAAAGCGGAGSSASGSGPTIVVTTTILGDVVTHLVGDEAQVEVLMPPNADPHEFSASARQATSMREADVIVTNGGGFEAGLDDAVAAAEDDGVTVFAALDAVDRRLDDDPHFFTDPARMAEAARALADFLPGEVPALDTDAFRRQAGDYVAELEALDAEVEATLAPVPPERRKLVTNHDVFTYFADRYGFTVIGAVIPAVTTQAQPSAGELDELAATIQAAGVPAVFADTSSPDDLADALADEAGGVEVVELYSESLGEPGSPGDSYAGMMRTNAQRIAEALA